MLLNMAVSVACEGREIKAKNAMMLTTLCCVCTGDVRSAKCTQGHLSPGKATVSDSASGFELTYPSFLRGKTREHTSRPKLMSLFVSG